MRRSRFLGTPMGKSRNNAADIKVGQRFGRLTVFEVYPSTGGRFRVKAQCDCGEVVDQRPRYLLVGQVKSCGCLQREHRASLAERRWHRGGA